MWSDIGQFWYCTHTCRRMAHGARGGGCSPPIIFPIAIYGQKKKSGNIRANHLIFVQAMEKMGKRLQPPPPLKYYTVHVPGGLYLNRRSSKKKSRRFTIHELQESSQYQHTCKESIHVVGLSYYYYIPRQYRIHLPLSCGKNFVDGIFISNFANLYIRNSDILTLQIVATIPMNEVYIAWSQKWSQNLEAKSLFWTIIQEFCILHELWKITINKKKLITPCTPQTYHTPYNR